jgi:hypothetical protein
VQDYAGGSKRLEWKKLPEVRRLMEHSLPEVQRNLR